MDKKQYNNVIDWTLKHGAQAQSEDSLQVTRAICNELGVALPQGDLAQVAEVLATDDYMGWKACTQEEAQEAVNNGIPAIGISDDQIVMLVAEDEEQLVCNAVAVMMLNENNASYAMNGLQYYVYGGGSTETIAPQYPYVDIPQDGQIGTCITFMGYHKTKSTTAPEGKLKIHANKHNRYSIANPEYYAMIDGRMVIATKASIGGNFPVSIGDYLDVTFEEKETGAIKVYPCIMGETKEKGAEDNPWGHDGGQSVVEMVYHDYSPPSGYNACRNNPWGKGRTKRITKVGNYGNFEDDD